MLPFPVGRTVPNLLSGVLGLAALAVFVGGCANTCVVGVWNPPTGAIRVTAGNPPPACAQPTPKATVLVVAHLSEACESCSASNRLQSIHLSVTGIDLRDVRTAPIAESDSSEWQKLFPSFETHPLQIELPAENRLSAETVLGIAVLPIESYDRVRLRFADDLQTAENSSPLEATCAKVGANCALWVDGRIEPLVPVALESRLFSEAIMSQPFFVLPESENKLVIELETSLKISPRESRLLPELTMRAKLGRELMPDQQ